VTVGQASFACCCRDAVFCEGFLAPVLQELQQYITLQLHYIGQQQVQYEFQSADSNDSYAAMGLFQCLSLNKMAAAAQT
jgi:hypothetical protein